MPEGDRYVRGFGQLGRVTRRETDGLSEQKDLFHDAVSCPFSIFEIFDWPIPVREASAGPVKPDTRQGPELPPNARRASS